MTKNVPHTDVAFAKANGIEIAYDTFGRLEAPPLLLITGLGFQMVMWDEEFCTELAGCGYFVIRFDNRDMGLSSKFPHAGVPNISALMKAQGTRPAPEAPYTISDMAMDAMSLLDALEIRAAHVTGLSMGGMIGQVMAAKFPARVRTFVSMMSSSGDPALPPPTPEAQAVLYTPLPIERAKYVERWVHIWRVLSGSSYPVEEALARKWASRSHARGLNPDGIARQLAAVMISGSRKELLHSITVPTLVLHGDADPLVPLECGIDTARAIPGAKLEIIKGMGHALPRELWPRIIDIIRKHAV